MDRNILKAVLEEISMLKTSKRKLGTVNVICNDGKRSTAQTPKYSVGHFRKREFNKQNCVIISDTLIKL